MARLEDGAQQRRLVVGIDIGGTKVLAGAADADGKVTFRARRETPHRGMEPRVVEDTIVEATVAVAGVQPLTGVGVGAAGFIDRTGEVVRFSPHLSWRAAMI